MKATAPAMTSDSPNLKRWAPLAILAALIATAYAMGLHSYLTLQSVAENRAALEQYVANHTALALAIYAAVYIVVVALSLPGAAILSILGGFIFGWALSAPTTIIAATIGAVIVFQIVKTSLGAVIAERAGPFVARLSAGFTKDAFNYLLFLRLVPAFPFFVVNAVAGLCRVDLRTFTLATLIGIIPGSFAFAWVGRGLDSIISAHQATHDSCVAEKGAANCPFELSVSSLLTRELLIAFVILGVVALIPLVIKKWRGQQ
jgi:uncharacterized membrane protein YdjX (TVP38/TMEM64 family)